MKNLIHKWKKVTIHPMITVSKVILNQTMMMTKMKKHQRQPNAVVVKLPIKGAINGPSTGPYKYAAKAYWWSSSDQMSAKVPAPTLRGAHPPKPPRKRRTQRTAVE